MKKGLSASMHSFPFAQFLHVECFYPLLIIPQNNLRLIVNACMKYI